MVIIRGWLTLQCVVCIWYSKAFDALKTLIELPTDTLFARSVHILRWSRIYHILIFEVPAKLHWVQIGIDKNRPTKLPLLAYLYLHFNIKVGRIALSRDRSLEVRRWSFKVVLPHELPQLFDIFVSQVFKSLSVRCFDFAALHYFLELPPPQTLLDLLNNFL